jgi:hypothetical protein
MMAFEIVILLLLSFHIHASSHCDGATSRIMLTTLDLACPIAWKSAAHASTSYSSPTPASKRVPLAHANQDDQSDEAHHISDDETWLRRRYYDTLWLGEDHSPLIGFLQHLSRYENKTRRRSVASHQLMHSMAQLLKSRQQIRKRFTAAATALRGEGLIDEMIEGICEDEGGADDGSEREVIKIALESGPGSLVGAELRRTGDKRGDTRLAKAWLKAMESRE